MRHSTEQPTSILLLERDRDAVATRLEALASDPDPYRCEGQVFQNAYECAAVRGMIFDNLLDRIESLNAQIRAHLVEAA